MQEITFNNQQIEPSKIVCIGRNYVEHIKELNNEIPENMVIFNKPNSAISSELRYFTTGCRFEGELCLLIIDGRIAGLGLGLDLTHADIQNRQKAKGLPWERAKAFDGSAVFSEFVSFEGSIEDIHFELYLNGVLTQKGDYELMMYKPKEIIEEISSFMSLEDGDVIMTGTPKGVNVYSRDDLFEMRLLDKSNLILKTEWKVY